MACFVFILTGCEGLNEPEPKKQPRAVEVEIIEPVEKEATIEKKVKKTKQKVFPGKYYRIITKI